MKIVFLGTGHGVPTPQRYSSCAMIEIGDSIYFVDGGVPIVERCILCGRDITKARAMFTTHAHGDHTYGIYGFGDLLNWKYKETNFKFFMTEEKISSAMAVLISASARELDGERIKFEVAKSGEVYKDENISVNYIPTAHMASLGRPSYAVLIEGEGKRVLFSGDLSQGLKGEDFPCLAYEDIDLFVCEFAHFGFEDLKPHLSKIGAKILAIQHVYPTDKYEKIHSELSGYPFELITPCDMDEIEI